MPRALGTIFRGIIGRQSGRGEEADVDLMAVQYRRVEVIADLEVMADGS